MVSWLIFFRLPMLHISFQNFLAQKYSITWLRLKWFHFIFYGGIHCICFQLGVSETDNKLWNKTYINKTKDYILRKIVAALLILHFLKKSRWEIPVRIINKSIHILPWEPQQQVPIFLSLVKEYLDWTIIWISLSSDESIFYPYSQIVTERPDQSSISKSICWRCIYGWKGLVRN